MPRQPRNCMRCAAAPNNGASRIGAAPHEILLQDSWGDVKSLRAIAFATRPTAIGRGASQRACSRALPAALWQAPVACQAR